MRVNLWYVLSFVVGLGTPLVLGREPAYKRAAGNDLPVTRVGYAMHVLGMQASSKALQLGIAQSIVAHTKGTAVDPLLIVAILSVENHELNRHSESSKGATGLLQVMPGWTATYGRRCGRDLRTVDTNVCTGIAVFQEHLADHHGKLVSGLRAFNGCREDSGVCDRYVLLVMDRYVKLRTDRMLAMDW